MYEAMTEQAKKAYGQYPGLFGFGDTAQAGTAFGHTDGCGQIPDVQTKAYRVPLVEQLQKRSADFHYKNDRVTRAHEILSRHPEFEEFLELQDLIQSGVLR